MERRKLCVKCTNIGTLNNLPNYVNVVYKSNKYNYAVMFSNQSNFDELVSLLKRNGNVEDINIDETVFNF